MAQKINTTKVFSNFSELAIANGVAPQAARAKNAQAIRWAKWSEAFASQLGVNTSKMMEADIASIEKEEARIKRDLLVLRQLAEEAGENPAIYLEEGKAYLQKLEEQRLQIKEVIKTSEEAALKASKLRAKALENEVARKAAQAKEALLRKYTSFKSTLK